MATRLVHNCTIPDVRGYTSQRVFDGVRELDSKAKAAHFARFKKAITRLPKKG